MATSMSESSSAGVVLDSPPTGMAFFHRLCTDPASHHITIGPPPTQSDEGGRSSPAPDSAELHLSSSPQPNHDTTPELEIDEPHHNDDNLPGPSQASPRQSGPSPPTPTDDDDLATPFQTRLSSMSHNRGESSLPQANGYDDLPTSPKSKIVPLSNLAPETTATGRVLQRPNGAPKRSRSDFGQSQTLTSDEVPPADGERTRRIAAEDLPPQISLSDNGKADWQCFSVAYAAGMWNPVFTPQPPHGPSGRFSTDVLEPAPHSRPPHESNLLASPKSPTSPTTTNAPPAPLNTQWASFQQSSAVGSLPSEGFCGRTSVANPSEVVFSLPHPEREHADPFGPAQEPPRKLSEGLPQTRPMLPSIHAEVSIPRRIEEEKPADDTFIDSYVSVTVPPSDAGPSASLDEIDSSDEEDAGTDRHGYLPEVDAMEEFRGMPQYAHFIEDFPTIGHPTEMSIFYRRFGFLPAPQGPQELERRKALYNFNILHTAKDANFDRITHTCKLMFNTKMVVMSLLDADTSWYKSTSGLELSQSARVTGFCSHTILGNSDEPMVVLDAKKDWRFARNPHVVAAPNIRFFAGAPLRTSDGHNLGALCLIDDKPWDEFPPRSRLILKELAMVVMRELELWRDKLQLRIRGKIQISMEKFARDCLRIDEKLNVSAFQTSSRLTEVYIRAVKLIRKTLDLDGCSIIDISQFERLQSTDEDGNEQTVFQANPISESNGARYEKAQSFGPVNAFPVLASTGPDVPRTRPLNPEEHKRMSKFLLENGEGRIYENMVPTWIRYVFPSSLKYGMVVPLLDMDQQPFALICAHTHDRGKQFLEGYELQFLRSIGVIILSAVLQRRTSVSDRAKCMLISSVSHELRTPLHGILAAAELLADTKLDSNQEAFLSTVRTCGMQLLGTVNHVLDYTKLSSDVRNGVRRQVQKQKVNLAELLQATVESCWLGQRARLMQQGEGDSDVGSYYAPVPAGLVPHGQPQKVSSYLANVETVLDIGFRQGGWNVIVEPGAVRRIIVNTFGNSLKFTKGGYVQVILRELPHPPDARRIPIELRVVDTGKGMSKEFLKYQLFQPFSQENPLQPGTGLGLAIVSTLVRSEGMNGTLQAWSSEDVGTAIRVTFEVELPDPVEEAETMVPSRAPSPALNAYDPDLGRGFSVALVGLSPEHRGHELLEEVMTKYSNTVGFAVVDDVLQADIIIANETYALIPELVDILHGRALIVLSSTKGHDSEAIRQLAPTKGHIGVWHKPLAPCMFVKEMSDALRWLKAFRSDPAASSTPSAPSRSPSALDLPRSVLDHPQSKHFPGLSTLRPPHFKAQSMLHRRHSDEADRSRRPARPLLGTRGATYDGRKVDSAESPAVGNSREPASADTSPGSTTSNASTVPLGDGGAMLKSLTMTPALAALRRQTRPRVLVVEDNAINRRILTAYLNKKGFSHAEAVDGSKGVDIFRETPPSCWDVILMDINMPIMDGLEATKSIRSIEAARRHSAKQPNGTLGGNPGDRGKLLGNEISGKGADDSDPEESKRRTRDPPKSSRAHDPTHVKIFALTGLATNDDKRTAFNAGVDGYLVKPVSLASLDVLFKNIGF